MKKAHVDFLAPIWVVALESTLVGVASTYLQVWVGVHGLKVEPDSLREVGRP